jgi:phosphoenolpyruvate-protein kinase (PTS system EI component)
MSPLQHGTSLNKGIFRFGGSGSGLHRTEILFYENHSEKTLIKSGAIFNRGYFIFAVD